MKALITGASSGLGYEMAKILSRKGYDIIAVARREDRLLELKQNLKTNVEIVVTDVTDEKACRNLAQYAKDVDVLINNAGFGVFGKFSDTNLDAELKMLDTNVRAVHILTKLFVQEFKKRDYGYILNVASLAGFFSGPLFAAYYATKGYVLKLSEALNEELRRDNSNVKISVLCPGPIHTEFGKVANISFGRGKSKFGKYISLKCEDIAELAIKRMFKGKCVTVPGTIMKVAVFLSRIMPRKALSKVIYLIQSKKVTVKEKPVMK